MDSTHSLYVLLKLQSKLTEKNISLCFMKISSFLQWNLDCHSAQEQTKRSHRWLICYCYTQLKKGWFWKLQEHSPCPWIGYFRIPISPHFPQNFSKIRGKAQLLWSLGIKLSITSNATHDLFYFYNPHRLVPLKHSGITANLSDLRSHQANQEIFYTLWEQKYYVHVYSGVLI